tara:strand:- start:2453 stop:2884 length:432 start_codon:yes stop_codon:yes gene_type:complete
MKKLYLKNISNKNINTILINSLKNNYTFNTRTEYLILTPKSLYKYIKKNLFRFEVLFKKINENEDYYEFQEKEIKKNNSNQIPFDHKLIIKKTISFKIYDNIYLAFDIIDDTINDYYVINHTNLGINDILFKKDLSYIKNMLI